MKRTITISLNNKGVVTGIETETGAVLSAAEVVKLLTPKKEETKKCLIRKNPPITLMEITGLLGNKKIQPGERRSVLFAFGLHQTGTYKKFLMKLVDVVDRHSVGVAERTLRVNEEGFGRSLKKLVSPDATQKQLKQLLRVALSDLHAIGMLSVGVSKKHYTSQVTDKKGSQRFVSRLIRSRTVLMAEDYALAKPLHIYLLQALDVRRRRALNVTTLIKEVSAGANEDKEAVAAAIRTLIRKRCLDVYGRDGQPISYRKFTSETPGLASMLRAPEKIEPDSIL